MGRHALIDRLVMSLAPETPSVVCETSLCWCRMGRQVLRRILRREIGEISNEKAWFEASKMTPQVLSHYSQPLRLQDSIQATVEASFFFQG